MNFYRQCADALELLLKKKGNFKTILFDLLAKKKFAKREFQKAYSIIIKCVTMNKALEELVVHLKQMNPHFIIQNQALLKILLFELLFGMHQKLKGGGQLNRFLKNNEKLLRNKVQQLKDENKLPEIEASNNVSKVTLRRNIFLRFIKQRSSLEQIKEKLPQTVPKEEIKCDDLIPNLITMPYEIYRSLKESEGYEQSSSYIAQSKSSCFPAYFLCRHLIKKQERIKKQVDLIDACSAPGNKTTQLADYWPKGEVYAIERDNKRFKILSDRMKFYGFDNVKCVNDSFLNLDPLDEKFSNVRYILVDPTCSGSGMLNNLENKERSTYPKEEFEKFCIHEYKSLGKAQKTKVQELGNSQVELLHHAAQFPNVLRISYSTCSIYPEENEEVVRRFLEGHPEFTLEDLSKLWRTHGFKTNFKDGYKCLRADPVNDEMDGFFVALFRKRREEKNNNN